MNKQRLIFVPAIIVAIIGLGLIAYHFYWQSQHMGGAPSGMSPGERPPMGEGREGGGLKGLAKLIGQGSVIIAAVSFWWFVFKKKLKSPSPIVKGVAKKLFTIHTYAGWTALVITLVHGIYFLVTDFGDKATWSGIAAGLIFVGLSIYGYFIRKVRNKHLRSLHKLLSFFWIPVLFIHGGGIVILATGLTIALLAAAYALERKAKVSTAA